MAAEEPHRLKVLKKLTQILESVSYEDAHGETHSMEGRVFRGRNRFGDDTPQTFLSILEAPRSDSGREGGENRAWRHSDWPLLLQGWAVDDPENPLDPIYYMLEAVEQCLMRVVLEDTRSGLPKYPDDYMLGRLVTGFSFGPGIARPPTQEISNRAFLYMPLRIGLATNG